MKQNLEYKFWEIPLPTTNIIVKPKFTNASDARAQNETKGIKKHGCHINNILENLVAQKNYPSKKIINMSNENINHVPDFLANFYVLFYVY